jgi:hypothetical protein
MSASHAPRLIGFAITSKFMAAALPIFTFLLFITYNYTGLSGELYTFIGNLFALFIAVSGIYLDGACMLRKVE